MFSGQLTAESLKHTVLLACRKLFKTVLNDFLRSLFGFQHVIHPLFCLISFFFLLEYMKNCITHQETCHWSVDKTLPLSVLLLFAHQGLQGACMKENVNKTRGCVAQWCYDGWKYGGQPVFRIILLCGFVFFTFRSASEDCKSSQM